MRSRNASNTIGKGIEGLLSVPGLIPAQTAKAIERMSQYHNTEGLSNIIEKYITENNTFKKLYGTLSKSGKSEFMEHLREYTSRAMETPGKLRRYVTQKHLGDLVESLKEHSTDKLKTLGSGIYEKGAGYLKTAKDLVYSIPGRIYPYLEGIGAKLNPMQYLKGGLATAGSWLGKNLLRGTLYGLGAYLLYRTVKGLWQKHKEEKEKSKLHQELKRDTLDEILAELRSKKPGMVR